VDFTDASNGWYVAAGGVVRHTTNGGTTWTAQTSGITGTIYGVDFTDANNGWYVAAAGVVRHNTNGGATWTAQTLTPTTNQALRGVYFLNSQAGWAVGAAGVVYHTTNGGTTWASQTSGITGTIYGVDFTDANNGWYVAAGGLIYHTANGGTTWSKQTTPNTQQQRGIVFAGGSLWTCGAAGNVWTYLVDTTPPVTTASGLQADNHSGWQATSPTVTLSATDGQSGVAATYYTIDGGARQTYSAPFTIAAQGSHAVVYWSVDAGGNTETSHTGYVNIDTTAPVTTATGLQTDNHSGWTKTTPQSVSLTATDAQSGVATTNYTRRSSSRATARTPSPTGRPMGSAMWKRRTPATSTSTPARRSPPPRACSPATSRAGRTSARSSVWVQTTPFRAWPPPTTRSTERRRPTRTRSPSPRKARISSRTGRWTRWATSRRPTPAT
jgi:hypothetical protein